MSVMAVANSQAITLPFRLGSTDFADEHVAPADFAAVRLQLDRPGCGHLPLAVKIIFQAGVINHQLLVEPDSHKAMSPTDIDILDILGNNPCASIQNGYFGA